MGSRRANIQYCSSFPALRRVRRDALFPAEALVKDSFPIATVSQEEFPGVRARNSSAGIAMRALLNAWMR